MNGISQQFVELVKVFLMRLNWFNKAVVTFSTGPAPDYPLGWSGGTVELEPGQPLRIVNDTGCVIDATFADSNAFGVAEIKGVPVDKSVTIAVCDDAPPTAPFAFNVARVNPPPGAILDGGGPLIGIKPPPGD